MESDAEFLNRYWTELNWDTDDADFDRLFALARRGAAAQWRPFSEAPESRDEILVYRPDAGVFMALHCEEDAYTATPDSPPEGDFYWFSTCGEDLTVDLPTHFMLLPPPPEKDTQS